MWHLFFGGYAAFVAVLICYATHIALSSKDQLHRADAYRVLRLLWTAVTSASGLVAVALKLHDSGLL